MNRIQRAFRQRRWALAATALLAGWLVVACGETAAGSGNGTTPAPPPPAGTPVVVATPPPDPELDSIPRTTDRSVTLNGAGATFPNVLYSRWSHEYHQQADAGERVWHIPMAMGAVVAAYHLPGNGYDTRRARPCSRWSHEYHQQADAGERVWHIPMAMGAVVAAYHLPGNGYATREQGLARRVS